MSNTASNESFDSNRNECATKHSSQRTADTPGRRATRPQISEDKISTGRCTARAILPTKNSHLTSTPEHSTCSINERKIVSNNEEEKLKKYRGSCGTTQRKNVPLWEKLRNTIKSKFGRKKRETEGNSGKSKVCNNKDTLQERDSKVVGGKEREHYQNGQCCKRAQPTRESSDNQIANKFKSREAKIERDFRKNSDAELYRGCKSQQTIKPARVSQKDWDLEVDEYDYRKSNIPKSGIREDNAEEIYLQRNTKRRWDIWEDSDLELENYSSRGTKFNRNIGGNSATEFERDSRRRNIPQTIVGENNNVESDVASNSSLNPDISEESDIEVDSRRNNISKRYGGRENYTETDSRRLKWNDSDTESQSKQTRMWEPVSSKYRDFETDDDDVQQRSTKFTKLETLSSDESNLEIENDQPLTSSRKSMQARNMQDKHDPERNRNSQILSRRYNKSDLRGISGSTTMKKLRNNTLERREKRPLTPSDESTEPFLEESESDSRNENDSQLTIKSERISKIYQRSIIGNVSGRPIDRKATYNIAPESSNAFSSPIKSNRSSRQSTNSLQNPQFQAERSSAFRNNSKIMRQRRADGRRGINTIPENDAEGGINERHTFPERNVSTGDDLQTENVLSDEYRANDFSGSDTGLKQSSKIKEYLVRGPSENDDGEEYRTNDSSDSNGVFKQSSKRKVCSMRGASRFENRSKIKKQSFANSSESERCKNDGCKEGNSENGSTRRTKSRKNTKRKRSRLPSKKQNSENSPACAHLSDSLSPYPFSPYSANSSSCRHASCFHTSRLTASCVPHHSSTPTRCSWVPYTGVRPSNQPLSPVAQTGPGWRPNTEALSPAMRPGNFTNLLLQALGPSSPTTERRPSNNNSPTRHQLSPSSSRSRLLQRSSDYSTGRSTQTHSASQRAPTTKKHVKIVAP